jgi:hypothetical protein
MSSTTEADLLPEVPPAALTPWDPWLVETAEAEAGRLASAAAWVALRRRPRLMRAIAESHQPEVPSFDWEPWRAERKSLVIKLHTERIEAAKAKTKAA